MQRYTKERLEGLDEYFQDEIPASVFVDDTIPGMITLFSVCQCGGLIAKAAASTSLQSTSMGSISAAYSRAWNSLKRQTGDHNNCLKCRNAESIPDIHSPRRHAGHGGHVSKRVPASSGVR